MVMGSQLEMLLIARGHFALSWGRVLFLIVMPRAPKWYVWAGKGNIWVLHIIKPCPVATSNISTLGWKRDFGFGADALRAATMEGITTFCSIPKPGRDGDGTLDQALFDHIRLVCHGADCDGAGDEQACLRKLQESGHMM